MSRQNNGQLTHVILNSGEKRLHVLYLTLTALYPMHCNHLLVCKVGVLYILINKDSFYIITLWYSRPCKVRVNHYTIIITVYCLNIRQVVI